VHALVIFYIEDHESRLAALGDRDRAAQRFRDDIT